MPQLLQTHVIAVCDGHVLQVQEFGNPAGLPAVVVHGGPGSGSSPALRRGFDRERWRLICIDQRGCGGSTPRGAIHANTTSGLVADMQRVRRLLGIDRWLVVGGSWGAALAVAYAAQEPSALTGLLLRSAFLARREDVDAFFGGDAALARPGAWQRLNIDMPAPLLPALAEALQSGTLAQQQHAASAWWAWEQALQHGAQTGPVLQGEALARQVDRLRVQSHYLMHDCWLTQPSLLDLCAQVPPVPTLLLHASDDLICPVAGAVALHARLPHAVLQVLPQGGHDPTHPSMVAASTAALQGFLAHGQFAV